MVRIRLDTSKGKSIGSINGRCLPEDSCDGRLKDSQRCMRSKSQNHSRDRKALDEK